MVLNLLTDTSRLKFSEKNGRKQVLDLIRKKWLVLTPEELVRQLFVDYLISQMKYPAALIAVEKQIRMERRVKRFDLVIYNSVMSPFLLIECKSPEVRLDEAVVSQAVRYNLAVKADFLCIVNGWECRVFQQSEDNHWREVDHLPAKIP